MQNLRTTCITTSRGSPKQRAPAGSLVTIEDVGIATAVLAHDAARLITGETLYVDGGYHIME
jgi:enoyl-[acyl-carrier protein] reductase I